MNTVLRLKTVFLGAFLLLAFAYIGGLLIAAERQEDLKSTLEVQVSEQESLLSTIAETTARNGADEVTEQIIRDCSVDDRTQFDTLLAKLDSGLSINELVILERLFGRCGSFYSQRKSVMVARLEREEEVYEAYVKQLEHLAGKDEKLHKVSLWKTLVEQEKNQSKEFELLVALQEKIIKALLQGKSPKSAELVAVLTEVRAAQSSLTQASAAAAETRKLLITL